MNDIDKRISKLEESHSFAEHTTDQLSQQLVRAHELIDRLTARIGALESRIKSLELSGAHGEGPGEGDDDDPNADVLEHFPPHGAGPRPQ